MRAISDGYLPAVEDDYDYENLAGYDRAGEQEELPGYTGEEVVTERSLETETTTIAEYEDYEGSAADDQYGAPSDLDTSYAAPEDGYGAPGQESGVDLARTDTDYNSLDDYNIPPVSDPEYSNGNGFPFEAVEARAGSGGERQCPGGSIEECVAVCPGTSVRVYGACVGGCADRCPDS